jgi:hypothetical protein
MNVMLKLMRKKLFIFLQRFMFSKKIIGFTIKAISLHMTSDEEDSRTCDEGDKEGLLEQLISSSCLSTNK